MATLIPTASSCHALQLPPTEKDDRLNLNVRTGSASTLYNSLVFTYGGLTIGLELADNLKIPDLINTFILKLTSQKSRKLETYLSGELFYLNLIERNWFRVEVKPGDLKPKPRLFHEICAANNHVYVFGGLIIPDDSNSNLNQSNDFIPGDFRSNLNPTSPASIKDYSKYLIPTNDLWEFDLATSKWTCLHDGKGYENNHSIPKPRYSYKMTTINSLSFVNKKEHFGLLIAGGKDINSNPIYENAVFDLVEKKYVGLGNPVILSTSSGNQRKDDSTGLSNILNTDDNYNLGVDYYNSILINFIEDIDHSKKINNTPSPPIQNKNKNKNSQTEESIIIYTPTKRKSINDKTYNPLVSFKIGKSIKRAKVLPIHKKKYYLKNTQKKVNHTIPYNLRYPTGGIFGQNIVITGFLPNDFDISIFIYNKPTGKWSRLNVFCNHDYGSHRFWGGFAWQSHHKVVLIGNYVTSRTTSSIRYFTSMITVSLPITNILASWELASKGVSNQKKLNYFLSDEHSDTFKDDSSDSMLVERSTDDDEITSSSPDILSSDETDDNDDEYNQDSIINKRSPRRFSSVNQGRNNSNNSISFSDYVHYAAPENNFTKVRSVFPPAAITLGRNAFDRYGDLISDFEFVSADGDRIPVSLVILMERWGRYFIDLLAKGYVRAVDKFEIDQIQLSKVESENNARLSANDSFSSAANIANNYQYKFHSNQNKLGKVDSSGAGSISSGSDSHLDSSQSIKSNERHTYHMSIPIPTKNSNKDAPQFRLPFQDVSLSTPTEKNEDSKDDNSLSGPPSQLSRLNPDGRCISISSAIDPHSSNNDDDVPPNNTATESNATNNSSNSRKNSTGSFGSGTLLSCNIQDLPAQLPLPDEPLPAVPATTSFRSSSRKNSQDLNSPRSSLYYTLTSLRNIPANKSPRDSPLASPRASLSSQGQGQINNTPILNIRGSNTNIDQQSLTKSLGGSLNTSNDAISSNSASDSNLDQVGNSDDKKPVGPGVANKKIPSVSSMTSVESAAGFSMDKDSNSSFASIITDNAASKNSGSISIKNDTDDENHENYDAAAQENTGHHPSLLDFESIENGKFKMEPSLIPRKLYMPFSTSTLKAFAEYLYTGQVGNKWSLTPATLDNLTIAKFYRVPLLYDLISEVLFGIIGRKEAHVIKMGNKLKRKYYRLLKATGTTSAPNFQFPLDEYEGFMDTVDDGYLDLALLKKSSNIGKYSASYLSSRKKKSNANNSSGGGNSNSSRRPSANDESTELDDDEERRNLEAKKEVHNKMNSPGAVDQDENTAPKENEKGNEKSNNDSTDDSSDKKTTSNSEEDFDFELGYLDVHDRSIPGLGPRSKSIFDRNRANELQEQSLFDADDEAEDIRESDDLQTQKEKILLLNLESLVAPDSPVPGDYTIDLIYETGALTNDMKLMLRASNARQMSRILKQSQIEIGKRIEELEKLYEEQQLEKHGKDEETSDSQEPVVPEEPEPPKPVAATTKPVSEPENPSSPLSTTDTNTNENSPNEGIFGGNDTELKSSPENMRSVSDPLEDIASSTSEIVSDQLSSSISLGEDSYDRKSIPSASIDSVMRSGEGQQDSGTSPLPNPDLSPNSAVGSSQGSIELRPSASSSSLSGMNTINKVETNKTNSFRGLTGFSAFKTTPKNEPKLTGNREIDRRIAKFIKKDDKLKSKSLREEEKRQAKEKKQQTKNMRHISGSTVPSTTTSSKPLLSRSSSRIFGDTNSIHSGEERSPAPSTGSIHSVRPPAPSSAINPLTTQVTTPNFGTPYSNTSGSTQNPIQQINTVQTQPNLTQGTPQTGVVPNQTQPQTETRTPIPGSNQSQTTIESQGSVQGPAATQATTPTPTPSTTPASTTSHHHHHGFFRHLSSSKRKKERQQQQQIQQQQIQQRQLQLQQQRQQQLQLQREKEAEKNQGKDLSAAEIHRQNLEHMERNRATGEELGEGQTGQNSDLEGGNSSTGGSASISNNISNNLQQQEQPNHGDESLIDSNRLGRIKSSTSSNSINSSNTLATNNKKKHGIFGIKKSPPI